MHLSQLASIKPVPGAEGTALGALVRFGGLGEVCCVSKHTQLYRPERLSCSYSSGQVLKTGALQMDTRTNNAPIGL